LKKIGLQPVPQSKKVSEEKLAGVERPASELTWLRLRLLMTVGKVGHVRSTSKNRAVPL
jgi:hypothetical protein